MPVTFRPLSGLDRPLVWRHLQRLTARDSVLRFGHAVSDGQLQRYVQTINLNKDVAVGLFDDENLVGFSHGATYQEQGWPVTELGLSVERHLQGAGWGTLLLQESIERAAALGSTKFIVHTLTSNHAIRRMIKKHGGLEHVHANGELTAEFGLEARTTWNHMDHGMEDGVQVIRKIVDPNQPTVMCIHGAGGDPWQWRWQVMPSLAEAGYNSMAFSLPPGTHNGFQESLAEVDRWTRKVQGEKIFLAHSMGGFLIQHHLARTGERTPTLLVSSLPPFGMDGLQSPRTMDHVGATLKCDQAIFQLKNTLVDSKPVDTEKINASISLVAGAYDKVVPLEWQRRAAFHYRAPLRVLQGGHNLMLGDTAAGVVDGATELLDCLDG